MKFPYIKLISGVSRPILPLKISYKKGQSLNYYGLVDSGADNTYFGSELMDYLGIEKLKNGRAESVRGINGISKAYFFPIVINIGGWDFNIEAGFMEDSSLTSLGHGLLGQAGLFDQCSIKFTRRKLEIDIIPDSL
jgi:hypothetical protein